MPIEDHKNTKRAGGVRIPLWAHIVGWLVISVCLAAITLWSLWNVYGEPPLAVIERSGVTPQILFDAAKISLTVVAGVGGVVALVVAYRRQKLHEAEDRRQQDSAHRDQTRLFNERFVKAAEHLGSDKVALRIAGVYALASLADDWDDERQTCIEVLCAYLRMPYRWVETPPSIPSTLGEVVEPWRQWIRHIVAGDAPYQNDAHEERQVRLTIMRTIRDRLDRSVAKPWFGYRFDFSGAMFEGGEFDGAEFYECYVDFSNCLFYGHVSFSQCRFVGSTVDFTGSTFAGRLSFELAYIENSELTLFGEFSGGLLSFYSLEMSSGRLQFTGNLNEGSSISLIAAELQGGVVEVHRLELGKDSSLALSRATVSGATVIINGRKCASGTIWFNGLALESGAVHLVGDQRFMSELFDLAGTELSMDSIRIAAGELKFSHVRFMGSSCHVDDLNLAGGRIAFYEVDFVGGSLTFGNPTTADGYVQFENVNFANTQVDMANLPYAHISFVPPIDRQKIPDVVSLPPSDPS